jgi:hypothetical protein
MSHPHAHPPTHTYTHRPSRPRLACTAFGWRPIGDTHSAKRHPTLTHAVEYRAVPCSTIGLVAVGPVPGPVWRAGHVLWDRGHHVRFAGQPLNTTSGSRYRLAQEGDPPARVPAPAPARAAHRHARAGSPVAPLSGLFRVWASVSLGAVCRWPVTRQVAMRAARTNDVRHTRPGRSFAAERRAVQLGAAGVHRAGRRGLVHGLLPADRAD